MLKRLGILLMIGVFCAFIGYQVLQAASKPTASMPGAGLTANTDPSSPRILKPGELDDAARAKAIKDSIARTETQTDNQDAYNQAVKDSVRRAQEALTLALTPVPQAEELLPQEEAPSLAEQLMNKVRLGGELTPSEKMVLVEYFNQHPGESWPVPRNDSPLDNVGGPDNGNYFYVDNMNGDTATYDWKELRGETGVTWINSWSGTHDDSYSLSRYAVGFPFPFYGTNYDSIRLCTNGFIQFTTTSNSLSNDCLPNTGVGGPAIFPYWDDLHLDYGGITSGTDVIGLKNYGTYTVVEFDSIGHCCSAGYASLKFEAILFNDGRIKFQYNRVVLDPSYDSTQTIGVQSNGAAGSAALTYVCNLVGIQPAAGRAIWFYQYFYNHDFATSAVLSPTGIYGPNATVNVSARITNRGTSTDAGSVSYMFNGGPVVTEATTSLAPNATEDHVFATPITLPGATGSYALTIWTDLTGDGWRANDTLRANVQVFVGGDCPSAITLTTAGPDSALYSNCGAGDNSPGQLCGASGQDMVFRIDVPNGSQAEFRESTNNTITGRHTLRWGGNCPGDNLIDCNTTETKKMRFVNNTGSLQTAYLTVGNSSAPGTCGNLGIWWQITPCGPASVPFSSGFEGVTAPVLPNCWSVANGGLGTSLWETYATSPRTGTNDVSILGSAGNDDWLFSPGISLTGGQRYTLEYWQRGYSTSYAESLEVMAGTANTPAAMTYTVHAMDSLKRTVYTQKFGSFVPASDGTYFIGFHNVTKQSSGRTYLDDIQLYTYPGCTAPTVTVNPASGADSAALTANVTGGTGGATEFQWFTGLGCLEENRIPGARSSIYYAHTSGIYSCRAWIVDSTTCVSCDSTIATVIDCSAPVALPWTEGFESTSGTAFPMCWTVREYDPDNIVWTTNTSYIHTGARNAYCQYSSSSNTPNDWVFSPRFALTGGTSYLFDFWAREALTSTSYYDSVGVYLTTSNNSGTVVATVLPMTRLTLSTYTEFPAIFTAPSTGNFLLAFVYHGSANAGGVAMDDISLAQAGTCSAPTITATGSTGQDSTALVAAATGGTGGPLQYQWFTGLGCVEANRITGATNTTYYAHTTGIYSCRAWRYDSLNCSACDSAVATVINCSLPVSLPWSEGFEGTTGSAMPTCWRIGEYDTDNRIWASLSSYAHLGTRSAYCTYSSSGVLPNDWTFTPLFSLNGTTSYLLDFWAREYLTSSSYYDSLKIVLTTAPNNTSTVLTVQPAFRLTTTTYAEYQAVFTPPSTGTFYLAFIYTGSADAGGIVVDDISLAVSGTCTAPVVDVADSSRVGTVFMFCNATGGSGGQLVYQWYTGQTCSQANAIPGATSATYNTTVTGDYACRAYRADSVSCAACDWGHANVLPPPPGETCANAVVITPPAPNSSVTVTGTTIGYVLDCPDTCNGGYVTSSPDHFYSLTLNSCRRITMSYRYGSSADMQISVFENGHCCERPILCDDDLSEFPTISWETAGQRPNYSLASFVGGELPAGTYIIRCSYYGSTSTGPDSLTIYDNGPCGCDITAQPGDIAETAENQYNYTFYTTDPDGGCNDATPVYMNIQPGQTVCGVGFDYLHGGNQYRDTDWYTFTTTTADSMHFTVSAEFPYRFGIIGSGDCANQTFTAVDSALNCSTKTVTAYLTAGTHFAFVAPRYLVGNPLPSTYRATLSAPCVPDTVSNLTALVYNTTDIRLKWTARDGFQGTYNVYYTTTFGPYPGSWQVLATGLPAAAGPNGMSYIDVGGASSPKRYYLVTGVCATGGSPTAVEKQVPKALPHSRVSDR